MKKKKLTLSIDDELIEMCKKSEMDISGFLEKYLAEHFGLEPVKSRWKFRL